MIDRIQKDEIVFASRQIQPVKRYILENSLYLIAFNMFFGIILSTGILFLKFHIMGLIMLDFS